MKKCAKKILSHSEGALGGSKYSSGASVSSHMYVGLIHHFKLNVCPCIIVCVRLMTDW